MHVKFTSKRTERVGYVCIKNDKTSYYWYVVDRPSDPCVQHSHIAWLGNGAAVISSTSTALNRSAEPYLICTVHTFTINKIKEIKNDIVSIGPTSHWSNSIKIKNVQLIQFINWYYITSIFDSINRPKQIEPNRSMRLGPKKLLYIYVFQPKLIDIDNRFSHIYVLYVILLSAYGIIFFFIRLFFNYGSVVCYRFSSANIYFLGPSQWLVNHTYGWHNTKTHGHFFFLLAFWIWVSMQGFAWIYPILLLTWAHGLLCCTYRNHAHTKKYNGSLTNVSFTLATVTY